MEIQRCPECGIRLKTNYCDVCMKRVPFSGAKTAQRYANGSSAHRDEDHECVSFDIPEKKQKVFRRTTGKTKVNTKKVKISAIILAALSVISSLFGLVEDLIAEEPDYQYEEYVVAGESGAENVPGITPTELYNDGQIIVTADFAGLYYDDYTIFMTVINESVNDIIVGTDLLSVNGYMHSGSLYAEVGAGESVQESLQLYSWELETAGVEKVAKAEFYLNIFDAKDYDDIARSELITLETDIADTYEQPEFMDGWEIYRDEKLAIRLVSTGAYYGDCDVQLYIENLSDQTVSVSTSSVQVNGREADGNLWCTLRSGTRAISGVYLYDLTDEAGEAISGLEGIEEIALDLHIEYMEDWFVAETINETIAFNPNELSPAFE